MWDKIGLVLAIALVVLTFQSIQGLTLFSVGQEFKYNYETLVTVGSEKPVSHASAYKIKGFVLVAAISPTLLHVQLANLTVGLYNGPWSYFPIPDMEYVTAPSLEPLTQPFQVAVESGKVKGILLDDQEPEWASNMKRGLTTFLQMDLDGINFNEVTLEHRNELTTMGECTTKYEVLPSTTTLNGLVRVNKFRNHADCLDVPTRTRYATHIFYPCHDEYTRDTMNSTAYGTYDLEVSRDGQPALKSLTVFSSVLFWPFTSAGPYQFSWVNMTLTLESVAKLNTSAYPPPPNSETHEDIGYVFEQSDLVNDPEDENPELTNEVLFFHHLSVDLDPDTLRKTREMVKRVIARIAESLTRTESFFNDMKRFHSDSPLALIPLIASLDYESLQELYTDFAEERSKITNFQLYLDGLILAGTTPATLVIRDALLLGTGDVAILIRLAPALPHFIRNPTEALAKELDLLLALTTNTDINWSIRRTLLLSLASTIGRCCQKTNCTNSGLLDKYTVLFENKLTSSDFGERGVGILGLRNLRYGRALDKVLDIASGKLSYEFPIRIQAIWSLRTLAYTKPESLRESIYPLFFNRSESCELRTSVFSFVASTTADSKFLHNAAYFMWSETCPMVSNLVRSTLLNSMKSKSPCGSSLNTYARTILHYLPPGEVDPLKTTAFKLDYYDRVSGFGHQVYATVHKSGETALPTSIYLGLNNYIGGYGSSYLGIFIRLAGVEKALANKLASLRYTDIQEIRNILSKIRVTPRNSSPLYIEVTILYHDYAILHYAVDDRSLATLPLVLKDLSEMLSHFDNIPWERSLMLGGIFYEYPLEIGTPISITAAATAIGSFNKKTEQTAHLRETTLKLQFNLFGMSRISNHAPGLGTMHSMTAHRALRLVIPRHYGFNVSSEKLSLFLTAPRQNDPLLAMAHGTSIVSLEYDAPNRAKDNLALELLKKSCNLCQQHTIVSRGPQFRQSRLMPDIYPKLLRGMISEIKYFDCERDYSRRRVLDKFQKIFNEENQYSGIYSTSLAKLFLSLSHARDYIFVAPFADTCGIMAQIAQNDTAPTVLETIQVELERLKFGDSIGKNNISISLAGTVNVNSNGARPSHSQLRFQLAITERSPESQAINFKLQASDDLTDNYGIVCVKIDTSSLGLPDDMLSYEGENEPKSEQNIKISMARIPRDAARHENIAPCLDNYATFQVSGIAQRSYEQKAQAASAVYPYSQCRADARNPDYPGTYVPPSAACHEAIWEQSNLRNNKFTIRYKVIEQIQKRLQLPVNFITSLLSPYALSTEENLGSYGQNTAVQYFEGSIEADINIGEIEPKLNLSWFDQTHNRREIFENIDLDFLPSFIRPTPIPSRMSGFWTFAFKNGVVSHCSVTPARVNTLDGFSYASILSDCWTLLSADCGQNAQFLILGKRISPEKIGILVHFGEHRIEFSGSADPLIDGKQVKLEDREPYVSDSPHGLPFEVFKNGREGYVLNRIVGVFIRYTGHFVTLTVRSQYRSVHCGLCGNWDENSYNDLVGPDSRCPTFLRPDNMSKAYIVNEGKCVQSDNQCVPT